MVAKPLSTHSTKLDRRCHSSTGLRRAAEKRRSPRASPGRHNSLAARGDPRQDFSRITGSKGDTNAELQRAGNGSGRAADIIQSEDALDQRREPPERQGRRRSVDERPGSPLRTGPRPGWKVYPYVVIKPGETYTVADIEGLGAIQSMWLIGEVARKGPVSRFSIPRITWDDQSIPSVECPCADFFASGWGQFAQISSLPVAVNPHRGCNSIWPMPFRKRCRMTLEDRHHEPVIFHSR